MKYLTILCVLLFAVKNYEIIVLNKKAISDKITLEFKNKSSKPIFFFKGRIGSNYEIKDEKNIEIFRRQYSTWEPEYFAPKISEDLISRTALRY